MAGVVMPVTVIMYSVFVLVIMTLMIVRMTFMIVRMIMFMRCKACWPLMFVIVHLNGPFPSKHMNDCSYIKYYPG